MKGKHKSLCQSCREVLFKKKEKKKEKISYLYKKQLFHYVLYHVIGSRFFRITINVLDFLG